MLDQAPIPQVHYTCTHCEVGWSAAVGSDCWNCQKPSLLMEYVVLWYMKQYSKPLWRARTDTHTTGEST